MIDYRVIAVDETRNWDSSITDITGKIAGVYVVNFGEVTHLCSMTGSYWGEFLRNITEHYVREPDGYRDGEPIWDKDWADENPEDFARSVALEKVWGGNFYGIANENGGKSGSYFNDLNPDHGSEIELDLSEWDADMSEMSDDEKEEYRKQRDQSAYDAAREYECNGEEWEDLAPWKREAEA